MIGVFVSPGEKCAAEEFFELCKTPWEHGRTDRRYPIVITTQENSPPATLTLRFRGGCQEKTTPQTLLWQKERLPVYCGVSSPAANSDFPLISETTGHALVAITKNRNTLLVEIGYNLFAEVAYLLTEGQPVENANIPTLDLHATLLRDLITRAGQPFIEIPPVPAGYAFIGCLSHDIDHPVLRNHRLDHTMLGYLQRALVGSGLDLLRGKRPVRTLIRNWLAAARLPFVHLGLCKDPWTEFDRFAELEKQFDSTFFAIPKKGVPGFSPKGTAPAARGCAYDISEIAPQLHCVQSTGNEVGLHGIDAWHDEASATSERTIVENIAATGVSGVRMHWLYFGPQTLGVLDRAGFTYDSTVGYNETIGYKAGTTQAYRPLEAKKLLELPLHLMDTALFYPSYLNLGEKEAAARIQELFANAQRFGGILTVNWHDRSIFPERCWDGTYRLIIEKLQSSRAWCPTMSTAAAWFNLRRSTTLECDGTNSDRLTLKTPPAANGMTLPGLIIRVHRAHPRPATDTLADGPSLGYQDLDATTTIDLAVSGQVAFQPR
jgi:hypothetical protein